MKQYKYCNQLFINAAYPQFYLCPSLYAFSEAKKAALTKSTSRLVGVPGLEPGTSSLSGTRSNQLSYTPIVKFNQHCIF